MQTIDLDELWHAMPQTTGVTASGMMAAARALHTDRLYRQGHHDADVLNSGVEQSAPSTAHNDLSAIEMPDLEIRPAAPTFDLRNRLPRLDGFLKSFDTSSAVWLSMGFISGMIAWHSVGFWGFVTEAVLQPGDRDYKIAVATTTPALEQPLAGSARLPLTTGALADKPRAGATACVALAVDRRSSQTLAQPCSTHDTQMRDAGRGQRADRLSDARERLHAPQAWGAEAQTAPSNPATSSDTAVPPDFDLTLSAE